MSHLKNKEKLGGWFWVWEWMREQLTYIKEQFEESELRSLARGHYSDAIKVLQEAAEQAEQQPYQSWVRM